jgi:chromosome segregation ATPase
MDDIRDTRPWFWILTAVLFAIAVVGLIIAISANNSSTDEKKVVKEAKSEVEEEVAGLNGALKEANEFQEESDELAQQDRARIRRAVRAANSDTNTRVNRLNNRVARVEKGQDEVRAQNATLRKEVTSLTLDIEALEAETSTLNRKIRQLNANGGT